VWAQMLIFAFTFSCLLWELKAIVCFALWLWVLLVFGLSAKWLLCFFGSKSNSKKLVKKNEHGNKTGVA
jgi:hypothetical protein